MRNCWQRLFGTLDIDTGEIVRGCLADLILQFKSTILLFLLMVNFGMDMIGKTEKTV